MKPARMIHLECARGIASVIVLFNHFSLAFFPQIKDHVWNRGLQDTPLYFIVNGAGAVTFFFVLSGFVLTIGFYNRPSPGNLIASVIKRLPRLMLPAGISILLGLFILCFTHEQYKAAADLSHSDWLASFGNAKFPVNFTPSIADAFKQSFLVFVTRENFYYNSNLWTMANELFGSMIVFGIAFLFFRKGFSGKAFMVSLHILLMAVFSIYHPAFTPFVVGSLLAYGEAHQDGEAAVSARMTGALLLCALIGFSFDTWAATTVASAAIMIVLLKNTSASGLLSGRAGELLGKLSFPLYLVHTLVILSASSLVYTQLSLSFSNASVVLLLTLIVTALVSIIMAIPFMIIESHWVPWLNRQVKHILHRLPAATVFSSAGT